MKGKSKPKLGQWIGNRLYLTDDEKKLIIQYFLNGNESRRSVYARYTGYDEEHGKISKWMRKFDIEDKCVKISKFVDMSKRKTEVNKAPEDFETLKLKKRIEELEKQLHTAEMKAVAFSTMVDIAEREFNIPIRKKHGTKP